MGESKKRSRETASVEVNAEDPEQDVDATFYLKDRQDDQAELVDTVFEIREIHSAHFLTVKSYLTGYSSLLDDKLNTSEISNLIIDQVNMGGVLASPADGDESEDEFEGHGFYTILSLSQFKELNYIREWVLSGASDDMRRHILRVPEPSDDLTESKERMKSNIGVFVCQHVLNLPIPVMNLAFSNLKKDIEWSQTVTDPSVGMTEQERKFCFFDEILHIFPISLIKTTQGVQKKQKIEGDTATDHVQVACKKDVRKDNLVFHAVWHEALYDLAVLKKAPWYIRKRDTKSEALIDGKVALVEDHVCVILMDYSTFVNVSISEE